MNIKTIIIYRDDSILIICHTILILIKKYI